MFIWRMIRLRGLLRKGYRERRAEQALVPLIYPDGARAKTALHISLIIPAVLRLRPSFPILPAPRQYPLSARKIPGKLRAFYSLRYAHAPRAGARRAVSARNR